METRIGGGEGQVVYGLGPAADLREAMGTRSAEWDPNDWRWDGDLFIATATGTSLNCNSNPSNYHSHMGMGSSSQFFLPQTRLIPFSNSSSSSSDDANLPIDKDKTEFDDKRRRLVVVEDDGDDDDDHGLENEAGGLTLNLGAPHGYPITDTGKVVNWQGTSAAKKTKLAGPTPSISNRAATCQVQDCGADLRKAKDYHRRHKVCEMHSKASRALVAHVMQRFCQQCSRFHALEEFDEGKRSCRRRLAGHNKRRRKTQPANAVNSSSDNDNQASGYLLISLLRMLSNMHSNRTNRTYDQDLLSHILRSLTSHGGLHGDTNISGLLQESQNMLNSGLSHGNMDMVSALLSNGSQVPLSSKEQHCTVPASEISQKEIHVNGARNEDAQAAYSQCPSIPFPTQGSPAAYTEARDSSAGRSKLNNFDLNDVYIDSDDGIEDVERSPVTGDLNTSSLEGPSCLQQDSHQFSPPQTSGNSESTSAQSPSSSSGDDQSCTDRIVLKLFGKEPSDFPFMLRAQILDWLSHSPTDIESYIRPGCIILTIYLRLSESAWEELCCDLGSSLSRLMDVLDDDTFWTTGWAYVMVQNHIAFVYNGRVVVDTSLPLESYDYSEILTVKPIAIPESERAQFLVKGFNLLQPTTRLLCALESNYLVLEANNEVVDDADSLKDRGELQCFSFSCSMPAVTGRGFIEVEDHGLSSSFFPFIVAEKDVCSEIRTLESEIESTQTNDIQGASGKMEARNQAMDFINEMGWLLHRSHLTSRLGHVDPNSDLFSFKRFKWLIEFSMDHDWCAVVKKLLDILFDGTVGTGEQPFLKFALWEMGLLHRAVRRNSRPLVELLLRYVPEKVADELRLEHNLLVGDGESFLFRPDVVGPGGSTPLHVAAGRDDSEDLLDALIDDPGKVGVEAWKNARDSTGFTPEDCARMRGHYSYIHLFQKKINKKAVTGCVVLDIPSALSDCNVKQKQDVGTGSFQIDRTGVRPIPRPCSLCSKKLAYGRAGRSMLYRPAMLSMVAVAAVCVCVALLFKSSPEVLYVFRPFRWEMVDYGFS